MVGATAAGGRAGAQRLQELASAGSKSHALAAFLGYDTSVRSGSGPYFMDVTRVRVPRENHWGLLLPARGSVQVGPELDIGASPTHPLNRATLLQPELSMLPTIRLSMRRVTLGPQSSAKTLAPGFHDPHRNLRARGESQLG